MGERGFLKYLSLQSQIQTIEKQHASLLEDRTELETKVVKLRPSTLDRDLLEERARYVLGYAHPDEMLITNVN